MHLFAEFLLDYTESYGMVWDLIATVVIRIQQLSVVSIRFEWALYKQTGQRYSDGE